MGEYTEIQGQIARIEAVWAALNNAKPGKGRARVSIGTAADREANESSPTVFFAAVGDATEYRPTIAGALLALESALAFVIEDQIKDLDRLKDLRSKLKLPEIMIGGDK